MGGFETMMMVIVMVMVVVESHPSRTKRSGRICSSREVLQAANVVCNLTRRSAPASVFSGTLSSASRGVTAVASGGVTAGDAFGDAYSGVTLSTPSPRNLDWLYGRSYKKPFRVTSPSPETRFILNNGISNRKRASTVVNLGTTGVVNSWKNLIGTRESDPTGVTGRIRNRQNPVVKRHLNAETLTLRELRIICCVRECTIQDFLGACS